LALTPGNGTDITKVIALLSLVAKLKRLLADKACDVDSLRHWLKQERIKPIIPSTASRRTPRSARAQGIAPPKWQRALVLKSQELAPHRNKLRPPCPEPPLSAGTHYHHFCMDTTNLNEPSSYGTSSIFAQPHSVSTRATYRLSRERAA
jgi:hypothetical protein